MRRRPKPKLSLRQWLTFVAWFVSWAAAFIDAKQRVESHRSGGYTMAIVGITLFAVGIDVFYGPERRARVEAEIASAPRPFAPAARRCVRCGREFWGSFDECPSCGAGDGFAGL